jgi:enediyne biosynthesis protein E4
MFFVDRTTSVPGLLLLALLVAGEPSRKPAAKPAPANASTAIHPGIFADITQPAGIRFLHDNGAFGKKYLPETLGPGCAFIDYDNDGNPDILLVNGRGWPGHGNAAGNSLKLYHNNGDGTFTDVTAKSGLAANIYGLGVAIGDYDNDGFDDIFITAVGQSHLFHNNHNGTFTDVTKQAGMSGINEFSTSAAWVDYDRDGKLDLIVGNYVDWSPQKDINCTLDGTHKSYCTPESYPGVPPRVWHNLGNGKFEDVSQKTGLRDASKTLGVTILDYNGDGWPDLLFANDTQPNKLFLNNRNGTFTEKGVQAGIAFSEDGIARAGMGVDAGDYDHSGRPSIIISNFSNQMMALYHNEGNGLFVDEAPRSEIGRASLLTLGFSCFFFDYDLDGWPDIFVANGHIEDDIEKIQQRIKYRQPPHLFHNLGQGRFEEVAARMGPAFKTPRLARGAAYADINNDGYLDLLITTNSGAPVLFRNPGGQNRGLRIKLAGTKSNRNGVGAVVRLKKNNDTQYQMLHGGGYLSQSELVLTFGLGEATKADSIEIEWPSGQRDRLTDISADQTITIEEGRGIIAARKFRR